MPDLDPVTATIPDAPCASGAGPAAALGPRLGVVGDVADEIRWTFTKRWGWIGQILLILAIGLPVVMAMAWNPTHDDVRVSGFATSMAGWVLASALNTNQLGFDADRAAASFRAGDTAWRILGLGAPVPHGRGRRTLGEPAPLVHTEAVDEPVLRGPVGFDHTLVHGSRLDGHGDRSGVASDGSGTPR